MRARHLAGRPATAGLTLATLLPTAARAACPDCAPGRAARAAITVDPSLWTYVLVTALPFLVIALIAALAHRSGRPPPIPSP